MRYSKLILAVLVVLAVAAFFGSDLSRFLELDYLKLQQTELVDWQRANPWAAVLWFFALYVLITGLSLPGATILALAAGAIFGWAAGTLIVSFASTAGATAAFLLARFLLRDWVQERFGERLEAVNRGVRRDGAFYLFGLRLVPIFPFFVINLLMGLTPMRPSTYAWVSQIGMLPGTMVYVNAGTQLGSLTSLSSIVSPELLGSFALLAVFPFLSRRFLAMLGRRRVLAGWPKPASFDRNLVVIGGGSAGLVAAYIAAAVRAKVTLVEKHRMGGDCLNTGCVPSKALIRSARFLAQTRRAKEFGFQPVEARFDFADVMRRVREVVRQIEPHDSVERYTALGVECLRGEARITSPYSVDIDGRELTTRSIIIATGARPAVPPLPGLEHIDYLTSDNLWDLDELPERLLVVGGGPIGCELSQSFARFGSRVTLVEAAPRLLIGEDSEISLRLTQRFREEGIDLRLEHKGLCFREGAGAPELVCESGGEQVTLPFDRVLVAVGRKAYTEGLGLEALGIGHNPDGTVQCNEYLQTRLPNVYVCGDVAGPYNFTHTAAHQAWYAVVNALFGEVRRFRVDYSVIPRATFTDPEIAGVGLNEEQARAKGIAYEVSRFHLSELDRSIIDGEPEGLVKVLSVPSRDKILGATIVGGQAGELIGEFTAAMRHGFGLNRILGTVHIYPTLSEAGKYAAGAWKRAHAPQRLLDWADRYHTWRRR
jgi:pyruvate/2-oxoglutarate dehydrogenase complex dihydrolipoamide dehydrogenase (E3) component/uncharacterized membrane protein YdjX (TVP38/TMEM64 family)